ncbi:MAG TPA: hypothetical protein VMT03_27320 [Polyangia bacterium]|nr:hypothetical protein [Polyangia bacterium]
MTGREPDRLRVVGASELERTLLAAAAAERPEPELQARMARAIGLGGFVPAPSAAHPPAAGASLTWPVISAGVAALAVAGAIVGYASHRPARTVTAAAIATPAPAPAAIGVVDPPAAAPRAPAPPPVAPAAPHRRRSAAVRPAGDLRAEIALLDAARAAVADGADGRALALLRRYDLRYPTGTFRPESTALRIEALARLGETGRARALAADFLAAYPDSPLAARVRRTMAR